jgi:hypothetical protein
MAAAPRIVTRREWGATTSIPGGRNIAPSSRRFFVAHWPVMSSRDERQWCRDIERLHFNQWRMGPGYNFLVGQSGAIYEGCGRDVRGIHSPPRNSDGFGVCFLQPSTAAGAPTAPLSPAMRSAGRALWLWLNSVCGRTLSQWWHGRDFATACPGPNVRDWVAGGMQADAGPAPPVTTPEENMIASALAPSGSFHTFVATPEAVFVTWDNPTTRKWVGAGGGYMAGLQRFAPAPTGHRIVAISATVARGILHVFVRTANGASWVTWQGANLTWQGGGGGWHARLVHFGAPPR